jgi:hypothetical protein
MWLGVILLALISIINLRRLIQRQLVSLVILMGGTQQQAVMVYSVIFLPGVMVHELTHFMTAAVLGVRTGDINIMPKFDTSVRNNNRIALGFVKIEKTDIFRESLIGASPLMAGFVILGILINFISRNLSFNWQLLLALYGILTITNTMFVSREDTRAFLPIGILGGVLLIFFWWLNWLSPIFFQIKKVGEPLLLPAGISLVLVMIIDFGWWICLKLWQFILEKITRKRVI